jgi:Domain of unknown function (DUF4263)
MPDDAFFPDLFVSRDEITRDEITAYQSALDTSRDEADMQHSLEANPRMLIQHLTRQCAWVIPQKRLGSEHVTDFVIAQEASGGLVWYAVELERPQAKMFNKNGDPSAVLNHALRQISDWRDWLSQNRDYAAKPLGRSGLGLIDIDPELEGLIIIGRDAEVDQRATASRRRRLERVNRVRIETYDWLLYEARERFASLEERARHIVSQHPLFGVFDAIAKNPRVPPEPEKAVSDVFGGIFSSTASTSAVREVNWEGVNLPDDPDVEVPLQIVYAQGKPADYLLQDHDWIDWIEHVQRDLVSGPSLLVTENAPDDRLQGRLTLEQDGIWYTLERLQWHRDREPYISSLNVLVYLPPAVSYEEKRSRVAVARGVFERYVALEREKALEQKRRDERTVTALSLTPGDMVSHDKFGLGIVISVSGSGAETEARIGFGEDYGVKHLVLRHAPLTKL